MTKVYSEIQERQMRIQALQNRIKILEMDIQNYSNHRGCIFMLSLCHDKSIISEHYSMLHLWTLKTPIMFIVYTIEYKSHKQYKPT